MRWHLAPLTQQTHLNLDRGLTICSKYTDLSDWSVVLFLDARVKDVALCKRATCSVTLLGERHFFTMKAHADSVLHPRPTF